MRHYFKTAATLFVLSIFFQSKSFSQSLDVIKNEDLLLKVLQQNIFPVDTDAKAVYLFKKGEYDIVPGSTFTEEVIIKILSDEAAKDLSWVTLPKTYSTINNIKGETYNIENGKVIVQKMQNTDIKRENVIEDLNIFKFNLPSVKKGSIIHYSYKRIGDASVFIPDWYGQEDYPVVYEEYSVSSTLSLTKYNRLERFYVPFTVLNNQKGFDTCTACSFSEQYGTGFNIKWVRRNVPAFKKEPFMESGDNYRERIRLQYVNLVTDWDNFNKTYIMGQDMWYGDAHNPIASTFRSNPFLDDKVSEITRDCKNDLEKAKAIYVFVRDSFNTKSNVDGDLKAIFKSRTGSSSGINFILTAMLLKAKLNAEPAFISTRENEKLNPVYQQFQDVNFFFSRVTINNETYNLDASKKEMPFGLLPVNAYNGYARTVNQKSKEFYLNPDDIKDKSSTFISIKPSEDGNELTLKGDYKLGDYSAFAFRKEMKNDTSGIRKEIIKHLGKDGNGFELVDLNVENLNNPDGPLKIHLKAKMVLDSSLSIIYFDPFFDKIYDENPFAAIKRHYPIQMDYQEDNNYIFSFQLPSNYVLDDYSKSIIYKYDDSGSISIKNMTGFDMTTNTFNLNTRFTSNTTSFPPEDYNKIRDFYGKLIEYQNKKIVLKKKDKA